MGVIGRVAVWVALVMLAAMHPSPAAAVPPASPAPLTLERVFQSPALSGPAPRGVKLSPDGKLVTLLRARADDRDRYDLWAIDASSGKARMLLDSTKVGSGAALSEEEKMRRERLRIGGTKGITDYSWAADGKSILVPLDGDLYLVPLGGKARRLTDTPASEVEARLSEAGGYVSFVRDHDLYVVDLKSGNERRLTTDGSETLSWGTAEFVAQEELNRFQGHWWSPDDRRIAVQRTDESKVKPVTRAAIGAEGTTLVTQRYPAAGTANAAVELWLMDADGEHRIKADLGDDPDFYLARVTWAPDGKALYVQRLARDQKTLDLLRIDPATGRATRLFGETSKTWVNLNDDFRPLRDGSLIWASERSGFKHLYRIVGAKWTQLTRGEWTLMTDAQSHAAGVSGVDEARHRLFFTANRDDVLESQLYWIDYLRPGEPRRLTERGWWNEVDMDAGGRHAIVTRSSPDQPPQTYLADADGKRIAWISENDVTAADHPYAPYRAAHRPTEFGTLKAADGSVLHWKMIRPAGAPSERHPVFMDHYGGPHSQTVARNWPRAMPLAQYLVSRGWIYFEVDNRGSPNRGRAFEDQLYHAMGGVEVEDQVAAAKWLKAQPYVDGAAIATYGWSYGGYLTLKLLAKAPGVFAAGIAGAPVSKWRLYDTAYAERYLGNPAKDAMPYARSDALDEVDAIRDPLLILHGMADDNVVFENSTAVFARLQEAKRPFEMMVYPGKTHGVSGEGAQTHVWRTITDFLERRVTSRGR